MTNQVHLVAVPRGGGAAIARKLCGVHTVYAIQYNARHHADSHLWQERFKSFLLDDADLSVIAGLARRWRVSDPATPATVSSPVSYVPPPARGCPLAARLAKETRTRAHA